jgi:hypothetical protein
MKIVVKAVAPLADPAVVRCTSDSDFLVYGLTNGAGDCIIDSRSTGASVDTRSPTFTVGGVANDLVIVLVTPGTKGFLTLQTANGATASMK